MANSPALNQVGSKVFGNTSTGIIGTINRATGLSNTSTPTNSTSNRTTSPTQPFYPTPTGSPVQQGTNQGLITRTPTAPTTSTGRNITQISTADIQRNLGISADGNYGPQTTAAVKAFQQANGLTADGIFGPQTLQAYNRRFGSTQSSTPVTQTSDTTTTSGTPQSFDYSAILNGLSQTPTTQPAFQANSDLYGNIAVRQAETAVKPSDEYLAAQAEANRIAQERAKLTQDFAEKQKNIQGTAGFLTQATGLEGILQNQYNLGQSALSAQEQSAASRLSAANTQQQIQQQGLASAAETARPILNQYGQANYGVGGNQGVVQPGTPMYNSMQQLARGLADGSIAYNTIPSTITSNPVLMSQILQMAGSSQGAGGFNLNQAIGQAQGQQATAQSQYSQLESYRSAYQQGKNLQNQFNDLLSAFNLNPSDVNLVNRTIQSIASNTSDYRYEALHNYINDIANTYAQILTPAGGSQTDMVRNIAASMLNSTASGKSLKLIMEGLDQQAQAKMAGVLTANTGVNTGGTNGGISGPVTWDTLGD